MPTVAQTVAGSAKNRQWIRCRVVAKSAGSEDPVLTSMGALLYERHPLLKRSVDKKTVLAIFRTFFHEIQQLYTLLMCSFQLRPTLLWPAIRFVSTTLGKFL
jgi:hypothetical protein